MPYDRSGFCVTCQKRFLNRYDHQKKFPGHIIHRDTAPIDAAEKAEAEEILSAATEEQTNQKVAKKVSGADFLSQPLFIATAGVGLGWVSARAFGPENALKQDEANGIAAGALRIIGRHFLKNVDMEALSEANGDINDALLIVRSVASYIGRKWQERSARKENESPAQAAPVSRIQSMPRQDSAQPRQAAPNPAEDEEAAYMQQQWTAAAMSMPYLGSNEAA